jgi:L-iditol 2-dehydrogenase
VYLEPGVVIAPLPDRVSFESYIGGGCGLLTAVHIIERARLQLGDTVVIQGAGAVGLCAAALARRSGAGRVLLIGAPRSRLDLGLEMGADEAISLDDTTPDERLRVVLERSGGLGADVVVEAAGSARAFEEGVQMARDGGTYVIAGHYTDAGESTINAHHHINRKHLDIRGCWGSEVGHFVRALGALDRHADVPWHKIGARTFGLDELNEALAAAEAFEVPKALVDPWTHA